MNTRKNTRAMIEAALMVALTSIFAVIGTYIPVLTFILFFIPVPFIILGKRHGMRFVVLGIIASAMIIGSLTEPIYSIFVVALPGITAIVMGYMMNKDYAPSKILIGGAVAGLISSLLSLGLAKMISGVGTLAEMAEVFKQITEMQVGLYQRMGMGPEKIEQLRSTLEMTGKLAIMMIPAALIMSSVFLAYANYVLTIHVLKRIGYKVQPLLPLRYFRLPKSILMGTFLIMTLTIATKYLNIVNYDTLVLNIFVIFQFIYLIQGLAVVSYFMFAYGLSKPLRVLIFMFILFNQMGAFMVAMIGFMDAIMNIRKIKQDS